MMIEKFNSVTVEASHDVQGVELSTPEDVIELSLDQAKTLHKRLGAAIEESEKLGPVSPRPFHLPGHPKHLFARSDRYKHGMEWTGQVGEYEVRIEDLDALVEWINKVKEYIRFEDEKEKQRGE